MSINYYNQKWENAISELLDCVEEENVPLEQNRKQKGITHKRNDLQWFQYYAGLYLRYLQVYRDLQDAYDQTIHCQKRPLIKHMLDNTIVRMCEVKQNLIRYSTQSNIVQSDFVNIDELLMDMKLTPKALSVPLPRFFLDSKSPRDQTIQGLVKELEITPEIEVVTESVTLDTNFNTAIRIIQKLERGRMGIARALQFAKAKAKAAHKEKSLDQEVNKLDSTTLIIQRFWRAFLARKQLSKLRQEEMLFLGLKKQPTCQSLLANAQKNRQRLKIMQKSKEERFQKDKENIRAQLHKTEESTIRADMLEKRRLWVKKFLQMHEFADLPSEASDFYKKAGQPPPQQSKNKPKKEEPKGKGKKNDADKFLDEHQAVGPSESVVKIQGNIKTFEETWATASTDVSQYYDADIVRQELRPGFCQEMERLVDGMIGLELDGMRLQYGIKKKKEKKKKPKKKVQKKVKIPQGLGKKDPKELLQELLEKGIAKFLLPARLADFKGQHNPLTYLIQKNAEEQPDPSLSQIRNIAAQYIGLPLGSQHAKDHLQKWTWFLFYGAMGTGKTMIIRALQQETRSIVFDLTPEIVKQRCGKDQLTKTDLTKLIWSSIICAKEFQPSIVMLDDFETIFPAGKSKSQGNVGLKMKKVIGDMKKNKLWSRNDRVAVIGCTNKPYDLSLKDAKKLFDKKIYFPYPNYSTRKLIFTQLLQEKIKIPFDFPLQTIAHITEGFTAGSIVQCMEKVLTPLRIERIKDDPLSLREFIYPLSHTICVYSDEYAKIRKFTDEVTGLKERRQMKKQPIAQDKKDKKKKGK